MKVVSSIFLLSVSTITMMIMIMTTTTTTAFVHVPSSQSYIPSVVGQQQRVTITTITNIKTISDGREGGGGGVFHHVSGSVIRASSSSLSAKETSNDDSEDEGSTNNNKLDLMANIKSAGTAGAVSLFLWELAFWAISIPVAIIAFVQLNGAFPDFTNQEDLTKVGAEAFAFANIARFALPVRIGLAVSTIPWVTDNIVEASWAQQIFSKNKEE